MERIHNVKLKQSEIEQVLESVRETKRKYCEELEGDSIRGGERYKAEIKLLKVHKLIKRIRLTLITDNGKIEKHLKNKNNLNK